MFEQRVFVTSPITLLPILKAVAYVLSVARQNKSTEEIVKCGKDLYASMEIIVRHVEDLGRRIEGTSKSYNQVVGSLQGRLIPRARRLKELGVTGRKCWSWNK